jgi:hypothetical protein
VPEIPKKATSAPDTMAEHNKSRAKTIILVVKKPSKANAKADKG